MDKQKIPFQVTDFHDGRKYDCAVDYNGNGTVTIWVPYGACVTAEDAKKIADLLTKGTNEKSV